MTSARSMTELMHFVAEHIRQNNSSPEFIVLLPDHSVRTAAWALGTILVGPYGSSLRPEQWPIGWIPLPTSLELLND